jgi:hypothetical protein
MTLIGLSLAGRRWELGDGNSQRGSERKRIKYEMIVSWIAPRELCSRINWKVGWVCQSDWGIFFRGMASLAESGEELMNMEVADNIM